MHTQSKRCLDFPRKISRMITHTPSHGLWYQITTEAGTSFPNKLMTVMLLWPKPARASVSETYLQHEKGEYKEHDEMRLFATRKLTEMWNKCTKEHTKVSLRCKEINLYAYKEVKIGPCWQQTLGFQNCYYKSQNFKLYSEVQNPVAR